MISHVLVPNRKGGRYHLVLSNGKLIVIAKRYAVALIESGMIHGS